MFISDKAYSLWEKNLSDKWFIGERGFGKLISPFVEIIEKRGWSLFCTHKLPGFATVVGVLSQHGRDERRFSARQRYIGSQGP